jgi:hypothetical protein
VEGSAGQLRAEGLSATEFEAAGFDKDRAFMIVEIAGDNLYFQTISRTGKIVDSGAINAHH